MNKQEIEALINILENKLNQSESTLSRFIIWQEIKSLRHELELLADQSETFY